MTSYPMAATSLLQHIKAAATRLRGSKLKRLTTIQADLDVIAQALNLNDQREAIAFVAVFDRESSEECTRLDDLADYFECSSIESLEFNAPLKSLVAKGCLIMHNVHEVSLSRKEYSVNNDVFYCIAEDKPIKLIPYIETNSFDQFDFCAIVDQYIDQSSGGQTTVRRMLSGVKRLEDGYKHLDFVAKTLAEIPEVTDRTLFYSFCYDFADSDGESPSGLMETIRGVYDTVPARVRCKKMFEESTHILLKKELVTLDDDEVSLSDKAIELFFADTANEFLKTRVATDRYDFLDRVDDMLDDFSFHINERNMIRLGDKTIQLENRNKHISIIDKLEKLNIDKYDRLLFYKLCYSCVEMEKCEASVLMRTRTHSAARRAMALIAEREHILQKLNLMEATKAGMLEDSVLSLTEKGIELFFEEDADLYIKKVAGKDIVNPEDIKEKNLFFEPGLQRQLSSLSASFEEAKYSELVARLADKGLPTGVAVLLYGLPGTGKTESVRQMAHATGRALLHVDISSTKTCWFGESEKLIKEVFANYRRLCQRCARKPILLFNEADAVFSKRKDANSSSVAQTENAIQNIILEELETLDGILVATTNMVDNLDSAFERRFLFKIRFDKPTLEAKINIWRDKLPQLSLQDAQQLAAQFSFSGGEIDNIVRKVVMEEVLTGSQPSFDAIVSFCRNEKIGKQSGKIGFAQNKK